MAACAFGFEQVAGGAAIRIGNKVGLGIPPAFIGGRATTIVQKCAGCGRYHWAVIAVRLHGTDDTFEGAKEQAHAVIRSRGMDPWKP